MKFTNPTQRLEIADYPLGGSKRGRCVFEIERSPKHGYRCVRTTTEPTGKVNKPKLLTYGGKAAIVTGEDGKTYILQHTAYGFISIHRWDFMGADPSAVFPKDEDYAALSALIG